MLTLSLNSWSEILQKEASSMTTKKGIFYYWSRAPGIMIVSTTLYQKGGEVSLMHLASHSYPSDYDNEL